jgi:hypothetical protein
MYALCINYVNSSSFRVSPNYLAILLKLSKSTKPFPYLSHIWNILETPSLDFSSPTLEQIISKN